MAESTARQKSEKLKRTEHRSLTGRIVVTGKLELTCPAHFGNGDADDLTDLPLLLDEVDGSALITGASLAGALRNYLRERQWGYEMLMPSRDPQSPYYREWTETENDLLATQLFGAHRGDPDGVQSPLIVDDARSNEQAHPRIELRDGVALNPITRTAKEKKKYDYQVLATGTSFDLRFELLLDDDEGKNRQRMEALALALRGLAARKIRLGARKSRGFGGCRVDRWNVTHYDLRKPDDLIAWLASDYPADQYPKWKLDHKPQVSTGSDIATLLKVNLDDDDGDQYDRRDFFEIEAHFELESSMLVRSGFGSQDQGPDVVHLHTWSPETGMRNPVLPGPSVAGAIRQRALRIANTLASNGDASVFINKMFGPSEIKKGEDARASRVLVNEEFITGGLAGPRALAQTRIKIDRFTGGTMETALLEEVPHFGGEVKIGLTLRNPDDAEIGLLLLVLKDLWLGDLPLGGEASVGRGRLQGKSAKLTLRKQGGKERLEVAMEEGSDGGITIESEDPHATSKLEACVRALQQKL